jgi:prevent-host-death family protein|tara:strand:+ start:1564 stop:1824 length:261 start_codon:yes stop_codon:yes gene_type:complete
MVTVTSSSVSREWGRYSEVAQREAVSITSHGRESLFLVSAEEYHRLKALDTRRALPVTQLSSADLNALANVEVPDEAKAFDHEVEA